MSDEPFGRQPKPVTVRFEGEPEDVSYWLGQLARRAEFKGDVVHRYVKGGRFLHDGFTIYPRAVND